MPYFCNPCQTEVQANFFDNIDYDLIMCPHCDMVLDIKMHRESKQDKKDVLAEITAARCIEMLKKNEIEVEPEEAREILADIDEAIGELLQCANLLEERIKSNV